MREMVVISGKGGTGKTSLTAAFAHIAKNKIICDLDVDAPDLHILLSPSRESQTEYIAGHKAVIDPTRCTNHGLCLDMCRYGAVVVENGQHRIDPSRCEGCKVCVAFCPEQAISFPLKHCGHWYVSSTRFGSMVHAQLFPGEENTGLLVTILKRKAREIAEKQGLELILSDGAPGIGCPVISSLSQTDLAVVVTEPTPSGRHDLERVSELCDHFRVKPAIVINKFDLNLEQSDGISAYCEQKGYEVVGRLPHDNQVTLAMVERKAVTEIQGSTMDSALRQIWKRIEQILKVGEYLPAKK
jgi:MinD superfamily P-loop ATPase